MKVDQTVVQKVVVRECLWEAQWDTWKAQKMVVQKVAEWADCLVSMMVLSTVGW